MYMWRSRRARSCQGVRDKERLDARKSILAYYVPKSRRTWGEGPRGAELAELVMDINRALTAYGSRHWPVWPLHEGIFSVRQRTRDTWLSSFSYRPFWSKCVFVGPGLCKRLYSRGESHFGKFWGAITCSGGRKER
jgi:hypothetical protein